MPHSGVDWQTSTRVALQGETGGRSGWAKERGCGGPGGVMGEPRRGSGLSGLLEVARSVVTDLDLDSVLERVVGAAREVSGARYVALGVLDESRSELA